MTDTTTSAPTVTKPDVASQAHPHPQLRNVASVDMLTPVADLNGVSNKWTELVKVEVGPEKQPFIVHRYILERSPFFEGCLRSTCKETESGVVQLPDASSEAFGLVLDYILIGKISVPRAEDYKTNDFAADQYALSLAKVYILARYLLLEQLCNQIIDLYLEHCKEWIDSSDILEYLHSQDVEDSKLMDLTLTCQLQDLRKNGMTNQKFEYLNDYIKSDSSRMKKVITVLLAEQPYITEVKSACQWHTHDTTPSCAL